MNSSVFDDVRHASRTLFRSPLLATAAVLTLAPGIGANTALFSVLNAFALRSLSVTDPARLIAVSAVTKEGHMRCVPQAAVRELERR